MNTIFCRACKKPIDASAVFCPACGTDQRPPALQPTQVIPAASIPPIAQPLVSNAQNPYSAARSRQTTILLIALVVLVVGALSVYVINTRVAYNRTAHEDQERKLAGEFIVLSMRVDSYKDQLQLLHRASAGGGSLDPHQELELDTAISRDTARMDEIISIVGRDKLAFLTQGKQ